MVGDDVYDAFMSYSHGTDATVAPVLQRLICRVGRPWFRRDVLRLFRDSTSLITSDDMWHSLTVAMDRSRYFVLMASPAAKDSPWVSREIAYWLTHHHPATLLIVLTEGTIRWDPTVGDFDWATTTALSRPVLQRVFRQEPLWEDVSRLREPTRRGQPNVLLRDAARTIAAVLYGVPKERVDGEDERESRRALRFRRGAISGLAVLLVTALVAAVVAFSERNSALDQLRVANARAVAAESQNLGIRDPVQSARLAVLAYRADPSAQTTAALMSAVERDRHVTGFLERNADGKGQYPDGREEVTRTRYSPDGRLIAGVSSQSGSVRVWDAATHAVVATLNPNHSGEGNVSPTLAFLDDGRLAVLFGMVADVWDVAAQRVISSTPVTNGFVEAISPDGTRLAVLGNDRESGFVLGTVAPAQGQLVQAGVGGLAAAVTLVTGKPTATALFPDQPRDYMSSSADGRAVAVLLDNARVEIWDVVTRQRRAVRQLPGEPGWLGVALSGDGRTVLVGNDKGELVAMPADLSTSTPIDQMSAPIAGVALGPDGRTGSAVDDFGNVQLLSPLEDHRFRDIPGSDVERGPNETQTLRPSGDGRWIASDLRNTVTVVDVIGGRSVGSFPTDPAWTDESVYFSADNSRFVVVEPGRVVTRSLRTGQIVDSTPVTDELTTARVVQRQVDDVLLVGLSSADTRRLVALWSGGEQTLLEYPRASTQQGASALRTGDTAVVQTGDGTTEVFTTYALHRDAAPEMLQTTTRPAEFNDVVTDASGGLLALNGAVIDLRSGTTVPLNGGNGLTGGSESSFVDQSRLLIRATTPTRNATGSIRTALLVWDVAQGRLIGQWTEPASFPNLGPPAATMTALDDTHVATPRPDESIAVWDVGPESWAQRLCGLAGPVDDQSRRDLLGDAADGVDRECP